MHGSIGTRKIGEFVPCTPLKVVGEGASRFRGKGLFAGQDIAAGEAILRLGGRLIRKRVAHDRYAMRIGDRLFLSDSNSMDNYINHSCDPNGFIDFKRLLLVSRREIHSGEELTYHYCTSEYKMAREFWFECNCACGGCLKTVRGFYYLDERERMKIVRYISPYLHGKWGPR